MSTGPYEKPSITLVEADRGLDQPLMSDRPMMALPVVIAIAAISWVVAVIRITRAVKTTQTLSSDSPGPALVTLPPLTDDELRINGSRPMVFRRKPLVR